MSEVYVLTKTFHCEPGDTVIGVYGSAEAAKAAAEGIAIDHDPWLESTPGVFEPSFVAVMYGRSHEDIPVGYEQDRPATFAWTVTSWEVER